MFGSTTRSGAGAYGSIGLETGVNAASPHKLIVMLFDGVLAALAKALHAMNTGDVPAKCKFISQGMLIIDNGLRASLDKDAGGEIAANLDALYVYMGERLLDANLHNHAAPISEVQGLLRELKESWEAIDPHAARSAGAHRSPAIAGA
ncbi:flagellar export chaperone FliS [Massilia brevitalea]|uniref:flagellar export chaperone FliS n=1 Tax=Massilia brevitalea TaxID=442526 RepID=UPI00273A4E15|nr:flagellar export chaperone FliS [Massilia brevitalea]